MKRLWQIRLDFGNKFLFYYLLLRVVSRMHLPNLKNSIYKKYSSALIDIIKKRIDFDIPQVSVEENNTIAEDAPIWFFWWQGLADAPEIVKICLNSIRENAGKHPVIILTKLNIEKYVNIPLNVITHVEKKNMSLTHFSDILRMELLTVHGGIWMDSTLLLTKPFDKEMYNRAFYSIHHDLFADWHICKGKWTGFFIASIPGNPFIEGCRNAFYKYWSKYDYLVTYLLIDYMMSVVYEQSQFAQLCVENVPVNNVQVFSIQNKLNDELELNNLLNSSTYIYKLSYKEQIDTSVQNTLYFNLKRRYLKKE